MTTHTSIQSADPLRRLAAIVYDSLLVIAVLIVATLPFLPLLNGRVMVPKEVGALAYAYWCWELLVVALFFIVFWTRRGQSLGMQAWRLHIRTIDGALPSTRDVLLRLAFASLPWLPSLIVLGIAERSQMRVTLTRVGFALLALGFANYASAWFDSTRRSWHDRYLNTRIVRKA